MLSMPPATTTSTWPIRMLEAANITPRGWKLNEYARSAVVCIIIEFDGKKLTLHARSADLVDGSARYGVGNASTQGSLSTIKGWDPLQNQSQNVLSYLAGA